MYLSKFELDLLAQLLEIAADEFGNHGCNDFVVENTPESRKFMIGAETWNNPEVYTEYGLSLSKDGTKIYTQDASLMRYFSDKFKKETENDENDS